MSGIRYVLFGAVAAAGMAVPQGAEAQSSDGWWSWALQDLAGGSVTADVLRRAAQDGNSGILDVILERTRGTGEARDRAERTRDGRYEDDRYEDGRYEDRGRSERGRSGQKAGPPFCRNGEGHPVHGRQWCRDKGFGTDSRRDVRWDDRGGWGDIILDGPRGTDRRQRTVDQGGLIDVLGDVVFRRVDGERRRLGGSTPLEGRWLMTGDGGRVLQIRSGTVPVAELTDLDGDRKVDLVLVPRR